MIDFRLPAFSAPRLVGALLLVLFLVPGAVAQASHYFLSDLDDRFSESQQAEFSRFGLLTTEDLLRNVATQDKRTNLASATGISYGELVEIARFCEFIQIEGIGPKAYDLLRATGVHSAADLAERDAASLLAEIEVVNSMERITGMDPDLGIVQGWIDGAREVAIRVTW